MPKNGFNDVRGEKNIPIKPIGKVCHLTITWSSWKVKRRYQFKKVFQDSNYSEIGTSVTIPRQNCSEIIPAATTQSLRRFKGMMSKMDHLVIVLVYFCSLFTSIIIAHDHDHRSYRPDTNPDMDLMPLTRFRSFHTTSRPLTTGIREPILLPVPRNSEEDSYEYINYDDDQVADFTVASSGYIHTENTTPELTEEEYVYSTAEASNAQKHHLTGAAPELHSRCWLSAVSITLLLLKLL
ncbi:uncharacterized protein NPIL_119871 [Nephila pilipes]|uniref:Uncharacterized protein n=1 Tax=Nephila pilipes TaxID=299642 RepID=A0A8X6Q1R9_NEPPI|nr:uncharacterized protein NPIL_119871 [Nephila pilipes]